MFYETNERVFYLMWVFWINVSKLFVCHDSYFQPVCQCVCFSVTKTLTVANYAMVCDSLRHANRGRLLLRTPGPVPLWDLHVF